MAQDGYESAEVLIVLTYESDRKWILDSGCSFHMTPNKDRFKTCKDIKEGQMILGNKKRCEVLGIGIVRIKIKMVLRGYFNRSDTFQD